MIFRGIKISTRKALERFGAEGVTVATVERRMYRRGWSFEAAVTTPNLGRGGTFGKGVKYGDARRDRSARGATSD